MKTPPFNISKKSLVAF